VDSLLLDCNLLRGSKPEKKARRGKVKEKRKREKEKKGDGTRRAPTGHDPRC
jgi:hypothetical protein